jgi:hypothetical protein
MRAYLEATSPRSYIHKDLERIEKLIGAASPTSDQLHMNDLKYAGFSMAAYTEAVGKYIGRHKKK